MWSPAAPLPYLLLYLFFFFVRPHEYPGWQNDFPIMPTLLILGFLTALLQQREPAAPQYGILLLALTVSVFLSIAKMGWISGAMAAVSKFAPAALLGFVASRSIGSIAHFRVLAIAMTLLGGFLGAYGIDQVEQEIGWSGMTLIQGRIRYMGLLADPNDMANVMLVSLSFGLYLILGKKSALLTRIASLICVGLTLWGIILTQSRGAFVGLGLMFILFVSITKRNWKVLFSIPVIILAMQILLPDRFSSEDQMAEESSAGRIFAWSIGLNLLKSNPLFGVGYGNFIDFHSLTAHNSAVLAFAELGLVGYLIWFTLVLLSLWVSWRIQFPMGTLTNKDTKQLEQIENTQAAARAVFYGLIGLFATSFFLSRTYMPMLYLTIGIAVGLYGYSSKFDERLQKIKMRSFLAGTLSLGIAFLTLIYIAVRLGTLKFVN
jgi:putative inorganic carbon (HCO3(-)) transporter